MFGFFRDGAALVCDGVPLEEVARAHGTPLYVYSAESIRRWYRSLDSAFGSHPHRIHYALKANSSLAVVRLLRELGSAVDANSIGEIDLAMRRDSRRRISCSPALGSRPTRSIARCRSA